LRFFALGGALAGLLAAVLLLVATPVLYPLYQGGQPLIPIPPSFIIIFELTMLGTMVATFIGFVLTNRFPTFGRPAYHPAITTGQIGMVVETDDSRLERVQSALRDAGGQEIAQVDSPVEGDPHRWRLLGFTILLIGGVLAIAGGLLAYDIIKIPYTTQMTYQESIDYEEAPRMAAPAEAIPVSGPAVIANQPGGEPVPAEPNSLQRGQVLYNIHCAVCHNETGAGNGRLSGYYNPKPRDLTSAEAQAQTDQHIYMVITNGFGLMPPLRENLTANQRWDVVNWVRTFGR
jgi:mono/diheme cytochrome c family protein